MDQKDELQALIAHLEELTEEIEEDHTHEFLAHIDHASPQVRAIAVRGLWESDPAEVIDPLWRAADQDPDEEVRATAISVLGRYIYEGLLIVDRDKPDPESEIDPALVDRVRTYLEQLLKDPRASELLRRRALEALAFDPGPDEVAVMEKWVKDPSPALRMTAIFAMGRSGLDQWEKPILKALDDKAPEVKREAIRSIGEAGIEAGVGRLEKLVRGKDRDFKLEAISALGLVGGDQAIDILAGLCEDEDEEVAEVAQMALEHAEETAALEGLEDGSFDDDGESDDTDDEGDGTQDA